jgi:hypothetical protein
VVVGEEVVVAELLGGLREGADGARVGPDLGLRKDDTQTHARMIHYGRMTMSARTRRRLRWLAAISAAGLAGLLVFLLVPNKKGGIATPTQTAPVQRVPRARQVPVTPQRHAAIDRLFDHFVPLAMARRDPVAARAYVTPNLREQATLADWRSGTIPCRRSSRNGRTTAGRPCSHTPSSWRSS